MHRGDRRPSHDHRHAIARRRSPDPPDFRISIRAISQRTRRQPGEARPGISSQFLVGFCGRFRHQPTRRTRPFTTLPTELATRQRWRIRRRRHATCARPLLGPPETRVPLACPVRWLTRELATRRSRPSCSVRTRSPQAASGASAPFVPGGRPHFKPGRGWS
jgi:hypothetical protein